MGKFARVFAFGFCVAFTNAQADTTGMTGGDVPFDNYQPSLVVTEVLPLSGLYPTRGDGTAFGETLGFVYNFAGAFTPGTSMNAQGQLLSIASNDALFSLLGTNYGGDGRITFALPNLAGSAMIGAGTGPGLTNRVLGSSTGLPTVSLPTAQLPSHTHTLSGAEGGVTGATGSDQSFNNMQPSLTLNRVIAVSGDFPGAGSAFLGQVATFAGTFAPGGWALANGQLLSIASNDALFSLLGTTYGGDGRTTFALPDLRGRVSVGADTTHRLGSVFGEESTFLTQSQMPAHSHTALGGDTGATGGSAPVNNDQPSLALNYLIATTGIYPSRDSGSGFDMSDPILGQIVEFAGNFAPDGWLLANGQLLPISQHSALFSLLGTTYGGDGRTTFALPDFSGRTMIGSGPGFNVGDRFGTDFNTLSVANLAAHDHTFTAAIPEPETYAMLLAGLGLLGWHARRRKKQEAV